jgi:hypothetical protein
MTPQSVEAQEREAIHAAIREAGGIVHGDGNIFFTSADKFMQARASLPRAAARALLLQVALYGHAISREDFSEATRIYNDLAAASGEACTVQEAQAPQASLVGLGQNDSLTVSGDVAQGIALPAADAQEIATGLVNLGGDGAEHHLQSTGSALPHGADGIDPTPAVKGLTDALLVECAKASTPEVGALTEEHINTFLPTWRKFAEALLAASPVPMASSAGEPFGWFCAFRDGTEDFTRTKPEFEDDDPYYVAALYTVPPAASLREVYCMTASKEVA